MAICISFCDHSLSLSPQEHLAELAELVWSHRRAAVLAITSWLLVCKRKCPCKRERSQNSPVRLNHSTTPLLHVREPTETFQKWAYPQSLKLGVQTRHTVGNMSLYTSSREEKRICRKTRTWYAFMFQLEDRRLFGLVICMLTVHTTLKLLFTMHVGTERGLN